MRVRAAAVDPNQMDSAAIMMAAEAVNSTEPIRSMFIGSSFLIDHSLFVRPTRGFLRARAAAVPARDDGNSVNHTFFHYACIYTFHCKRIYLARTIGRDCRPNRRKIGATLLSARFQNTKAADAFFIPLCVSVIFRTR